jgi:hypothetical protein
VTTKPPAKAEFNFEFRPIAVPKSRLGKGKLDAAPTPAPFGLPLLAQAQASLSLLPDSGNAGSSSSGSSSMQIDKRPAPESSSTSASDEDDSDASTDEEELAFSGERLRRIMELMIQRSGNVLRKKSVAQHWILKWQRGTPLNLGQLIGPQLDGKQYLPHEAAQLVRTFFLRELQRRLDGPSASVKNDLLERLSMMAEDYKLELGEMRMGPAARGDGGGDGFFRFGLGSCRGGAAHTKLADEPESAHQAAMVKAEQTLADEPESAQQAAVVKAEQALSLLRNRSPHRGGW